MKKSVKVIDLRFRPFFRPLLLDGRKTMTSRTRKFGDPGDQFLAFGAIFEFTHVFRISVGYMISDCFRQEGCASVQELMKIWNDIHPQTGIVNHQIVWAHIFRRIDIEPVKK